MKASQICPIEYVIYSYTLYNIMLWTGTHSDCKTWKDSEFRSWFISTIFIFKLKKFFFAEWLYTIYTCIIKVWDIWLNNAYNVFLYVTWHRVSLSLSVEIFLNFPRNQKSMWNRLFPLRKKLYILICVFIFLIIRQAYNFLMGFFTSVIDIDISIILV